MIQEFPSILNLRIRANSINFRARERELNETISAWDLLSLIARSKGCCEWCGKKLPKKFAFDHICPYRVYGATNTKANLAVSCISCNSRKADRHPASWAMSLCLSGKRTRLIESTIDKYDLDRLVQLCMFKSEADIDAIILKRVG